MSYTAYCNMYWNMGQTYRNILQYAFYCIASPLLTNMIIQTNRVNHSGKTTGLYWGASTLYQLIKHTFINYISRYYCQKALSALFEILQEEEKAVSNPSLSEYSNQTLNTHSYKDFLYLTDKNCVQNTAAILKLHKIVLALKI